MAEAPVVLALAPNGARRTKSDHPALPMTAAEIGEQAQSWVEAGVTLLHLHVRDENGAHSLDADLYRRAMEAVREAVADELVIQITTEAVGRYAVDGQIATVKALKPESASVALREILRDGPEKAQAFFEWARAEQVVIQHILYAPQDLDQFLALVAEGVVPDGRHLLMFVLGSYAGGVSEPARLIPFIDRLRGLEADWFSCAFGPGEASCAVTTALLGGHIRLGFENNTSLPDGSAAPDNTGLVRPVATVLGTLARPVADVATLRGLLARIARS